MIWTACVVVLAAAYFCGLLFGGAWVVIMLAEDERFAAAIAAGVLALFLIVLSVMWTYDRWGWWQEDRVCVEWGDYHYNPATKTSTRQCRVSVNPNAMGVQR